MRDWFKKISPFVLLAAAFAVFAAVVLHCTFYMINIHRWNKRM